MKVLKWLSALLAGAVLLYAGWLALVLLRLPPVSKLVDSRSSLTIQVMDWQGKLHPFVVGPGNPRWASSPDIPQTMKWAVILAEDANFYRHEGIDLKALKEAAQYDLKQGRLARGASTITQQTAKNLFLSRGKTFTRKILELYLAKRMEQTLTKERILELYLNLVELGPMVHGVGHGARYYFDKPASSLSPRECAFLAAMLPGPQKTYNPYRHLDRVLKRSDAILRLLRDKGILSKAEYSRALAERPDIGGMQRKVDQSFSGKVKAFFKDIFGIFK
jgi:monofunctional biosynthetic peptidoglycan transglycosylase